MNKIEEKNRILETIICILIVINLIQLSINVYYISNNATQNCIEVIREK